MEVFCQRVSECQPVADASVEAQFDGKVWQTPARWHDAGSPAPVRRKEGAMQFQTNPIDVACHRDEGGRRALQAPADRWRYALSVVGVVVALATIATDAVLGQGQPPLPARLDSYIKAYVKLTPEEQKRLLAGQPVTQLLESDPAKEVAIFGAVWVAAPIARYVDAVRNIEEFEKGDNFLVTKRISSPPRLEDFDRLSLPPDDVLT